MNTWIGKRTIECQWCDRTNELRLEWDVPDSDPDTDVKCYDVECWNCGLLTRVEFNGLDGVNLKRVRVV